jgi:hypothetical protein
MKPHLSPSSCPRRRASRIRNALDARLRGHGGQAMDDGCACVWRDQHDAEATMNVRESVP